MCTEEEGSWGGGHLPSGQNQVGARSPRQLNPYASLIVSGLTCTCTMCISYAITLVLTWSASIAQPSDPFGPESFSCANEGGLNECMQNFTEALMRSGLMKKTQEWQSAHAAISLPELSPAEFEELCQYGDTFQISL